MERFSAKIRLSSFDIKRLLNPTVYYVGAHINGVCELANFISNGIWRNGYGLDKQKYVDRIETVKAGDLLVVKRLMGKGSDQMKILAVGIALHSSLDGQTVPVAWVRTDLDHTVNLREIGTISNGMNLDDHRISDVVLEEVEKARAKFLTTHLETISLTHY